MTGGGLHGRDTADDAFYEWLLSDHPDARAEREYRRAATYAEQRERALTIRAWVDKINAQPDAPQAARDLAASMGPRADEGMVRAEADYAESDDAYVGRLRAQHETYMQVSGPIGCSGYTYPDHLIGHSAARHPAPEREAHAGIELDM